MLEDTPYYFDPNNILGKGSFGVVYKGGKFFSDEIFAIKEINLNDLRKKGHSEDLKI
jgi:serine/threonine protein kinase